MPTPAQPQPSVSRARSPRRRSAFKRMSVAMGAIVVAVASLAAVRCGGNDTTSSSSSCKKCTCRCAGGTATVDLYQGKPLECPSGCAAFCAGERLGSFLSGSCAD